jgi:hypothetical protein
MGKKMPRAGMVLRRAIRADIDANPGIDHKQLRSKHAIAEGIIASAMVKTVTEWDALIAATPEDVIPARSSVRASMNATNGGTGTPGPAGVVMPGLEQGIVKFTRKPAKMGADHIFWVPRVYIKNGLVDPHVEYEVYLKKKK